jgi:hypothetical protein
MGVNVRSKLHVALVNCTQTDSRTEDAMKLYRDHNIICRNVIELGMAAFSADPGFVKEYKRPVVSLRVLIEFYLRCRFDKSCIRKTSWETELTPAQLRCKLALSFTARPTQALYLDSANNVHCVLTLYDRIEVRARIFKRTVERLDQSLFTIDLAHELKSPMRTMSGFSTRGSGFIGVSKAQKSVVDAQHMRAYKLWRAGHGLFDICIKMGTLVDPMRDTCVM